MAKNKYRSQLATTALIGILVISVLGTVSTPTYDEGKLRSAMRRERRRRVAEMGERVEGMLTPIAGPSSDSEAVFVPELVVDGVERFEWPLRGMDCPDCAMKATRAVTRLPGIDEVVVDRVNEGQRFHCCRSHDSAESLPRPVQKGCHG